MKKLNVLILTILFSFQLNAQDIGIDDLKNVDGSNTWFKIGVNAGLPIGDLASISSFAPGIDLNVQYLKTKAYGYGIKIGYTHYIAKDPIKEDFSAIPIAALFRFYPESVGLFGGLELGYAFINNLPGTNGGVVARPQLGYHTNDWNYFAYYDYISTEETVIDFQTIGIGLTYNLRWK